MNSQELNVERSSRKSYPLGIEKLKEKLPEKVEQAELLLPGFSCNVVRFNGSITTFSKKFH